MSDVVKKAAQDYEEALSEKERKRERARELADVVEGALGPIAGTVFKSAKKSVIEAADRVEGKKPEREKY